MKKSTRNIIITIAIIATILIVLSFFIAIYFIFNKLVESGDKFPNLEEIKNNPQEAVKKCGKIEEGTLKKICFDEIYMEIREKEDVNTNLVADICEELDYKDICEEYLIFTIIPKVIKEKPGEVLEACKKTSTYQDYCFKNVAISLADKGSINNAINTCALINTQEGKLLCYNEILIGAPKRINEYPDDAISLCEEYNMLIDGCYRVVADNLRDKYPTKAIESCERISDPFKEENCYLNAWINIPSYIRSDVDLSIELCDRFKTDNDFCYDAIAKAVSQTSKSDAIKSCNKIADDTNREFCFQDYVY